MALDQKADLQKQNMRITLILWIMFCVMSMFSMLYAAEHKAVLLVENTGERISITEEAENSIRAYSAKKLEFRENNKENGNLLIPVEKSVRVEDIVIDNRYTDRQLRIYLKGADYDFYNINSVKGDLDGVLGGEALSQDEGVVLILHMDEAYEYVTTLNDGELVVKRMRMSEAYKMVVVLDPAGGGEENGNVVEGAAEKDITLNVALLTAEKVLDPDIKVLVTRLSDTELTSKERIDFTGEVGADIYLRLGAEASGEDTDYGIKGIYNEEYFIPGFGNLELADLFTRNTAIFSNNRAIGLAEAEENDILKAFQIPSAQIMLGNMTNEKERELLLRKEYQNLLASGLANAIMEAYENCMQRD